MATGIGAKPRGPGEAVDGIPARSAALPRPPRPRLAWLPLPLLPFVVFCVLFELVPLVVLVRDSFTAKGTGAVTVDNYAAIAEPLYWRSLVNSLRLSAVTAVLGAILGALVAVAIVRGSERARRWLLGLVAVTSNFAGVPLAFAFIAILGTNGFITLLLRQGFDVRLYPRHFSLYSWTGLTLVYLYFQLPLMILLFAPAVTRLRPQWREAAATLGAPGWFYWWKVGFPVMAAPFVAAMAFLFANALGAYATAYALAGGNFSLLTIQIGYSVDGDINFDPGKASALALILAGIMAGSIVVAQVAARRAQRWLG